MKIEITENQLKSVKKLLNEQFNTEEFRYNVKINFSHYDVTKDGYEIDDIYPVDAEVTYNIYLEKKTWGYNGISLDSVKGPEYLETELSYYSEEGEPTEGQLKIKMDWDKVTYESDETTRNMIGIDSDIEVELMNDENGEIVVKNIIVTTLGISY